MLSATRLLLYGALLLSGSNLHLANAQTTNTPLNSSIAVEPLTVDNELRLNVEFKNADVSQALGEIATKGNLQIVVNTTVEHTRTSFSLKNATPEIAIQQVCKLASLNCQLKDGIWMISDSKPETDTLAPQKARKSKEIDSMVFRNVEVTDLLSMISAQFDIPMVVDGTVQGRFRFIRLEHKTPRQAIDIIALGARLKVEEQLDGTLTLTKADSK